MARLGPFEPRPALAVAVSGGRDSMALALLARDWVDARDGGLTALVVDHGLRVEAAADARQTARCLQEHGIPAHILRWRGAKPSSGIQVAAREARYALLTGWCRRHGVLHLATAHHRDDQAETLAMRQQRRQPGDPPQTGMVAARPVAGIRLLRPLLDQPRSRLEALLAARGQDWLDDPSNQDPRFERVRTRTRLATAGTHGTATLLARAAAAEPARQASEGALARLAADCFSLHPAGFADIARAAWRDADSATGAELLRQGLRCIGGGRYPPPRSKSEALAEALRAATGGLRRTLAGCQVIAQAERILIVREIGRMPPPRAIAPGRTLTWDRYRISLSGTGKGDGLCVGPLGPTGLSELAASLDPALPRQAALTLPALWCGTVPMQIARFGPQGRAAGVEFALKARFLPPYPLLTTGLRVA